MAVVVDPALIEQIIGRFKSEAGALLPLLHEVQHQLDCVPPEVVPAIAAALNLSRAEVHGVISFYADFRDQPRGQHTLELCRAEACQAVGAGALEQRVIEQLGIGFGETTPDGVISLEPVYCLGNCACGPSLRVADTIHGRVTAHRFATLLTDLKAGG